jgi:hypothetical protein
MRSSGIGSEVSVITPCTQDSTCDHIETEPIISLVLADDAIEAERVRDALVAELIIPTLRDLIDTSVEVSTTAPLVRFCGELGRT